MSLIFCNGFIEVIKFTQQVADIFRQADKSWIADLGHTTDVSKAIHPDFKVPEGQWKKRNGREGTSKLPYSVMRKNILIPDEQKMIKCQRKILQVISI